MAVQREFPRRACQFGVRHLSIALLTLEASVLLARSAFAWPDPQTPTAQLLAAASGGSPDDARALGDMYLGGRGLPKNDTLAAYWYEKAAAAGDPYAENQIGYFYQAGIGVASDPARAAHWYQLAAANGFTSAKVNLGVMYLNGVGVPSDQKFAAQLFREAAGHGDGRGAAYLGDLYYFGTGVPQNKETAEHWYRAGARLHDPEACYDIGQLLSVEAEHRHDPSAAIGWFRKSVDGGYIPAMHELGLLLVNHPDLPQKPGEAASLLRTASEAGMWRASAALAAVERDGKSIARDHPAAYYHFLLAALQGGPKAQRLVDADLLVLAPELGTEQTTALQADANLWHQKHPAVLDFVYKTNVHGGLVTVAHAVPLHAGEAGDLTIASP